MPFPHERSAKAAGSILLLRANDGSQRFHTAWVKSRQALAPEVSQLTNPELPWLAVAGASASCHERTGGRRLINRQSPHDNVRAFERVVSPTHAGNATTATGGAGLPVNTIRR